MMTVVKLTICSVLAAVVYGVIFSKLYPSIEIDPGIITLLAFCGIATSVGVAGVWKIMRRGDPKRG